MYGLLVKAALAEDHPAPPGKEASAGSLLVLLVERRTRLRQRAGHDLADQVADQLQYDVTLMHLCDVLGIDHDPSAFSRPEAERHRLEAQLRQSGIDLELV